MGVGTLGDGADTAAVTGASVLAPGTASRTEDGLAGVGDGDGAADAGAAVAHRA